MRRLLGLLTLTAALANAGPASAAGPYAGAQFRYWDFSNGNTMRDPIAYWVPGPFHVQLEYWDFERGEDQFRPEVGVHLRDRHRSVYSLQWRHELHAERFTASAGIVISPHVVLNLEASPIVGEDSTSWVFGAGSDYYWESYNFFSWSVRHDPRGDDLWVVPMRLRLAFEETNWVQYTLAPASKGTLGWAIDLKKAWLRLGVEHNSRFDFVTTLDNTIFTAGVEFPLPTDHAARPGTASPRRAR
jgi:hypothetical protein